MKLVKDDIVIATGYSYQTTYKELKQRNKTCRFSIFDCYQTTYKELKPPFKGQLIISLARYQTTYKELKRVPP